MKIEQKMLTRNSCYISGRRIIPKGIMVHSLGVAQPDPMKVINYWNVPGMDVCVHAFVHKDGVIQTLPWDYRGWHAGGSANNTHIGFEICEPAGHTYSGGSTMLNYNIKANQEYFNAIWKHSVDLCAMLCQEYNLTEKDIITHCEGHAQGIASNHGDVMHWFPKHGKDMDDFRAAVKEALKAPVVDNTPDKYAVEALDWAVKNSIIRGNEKGDYMLHEPCNRQDMLVFIHRAMKG